METDDLNDASGKSSSYLQPEFFDEEILTEESTHSSELPIPVELWFYCFSFLDLKSLLTVTRVCKVNLPTYDKISFNSVSFFQIFYEIVKSESLWKDICWRSLPDETIDLAITEKRNDWHKLYQQIYSLNFTGTRLVSHSHTHFSHFSHFLSNLLIVFDEVVLDFVFRGSAAWVHEYTANPHSKREENIFGRIRFWRRTSSLGN